MTKKYIIGERLSAANLIIYPIIMQFNRAAAHDRDDTHALAIYPLAQCFPPNPWLGVTHGEVSRIHQCLPTAVENVAASHLIASSAPDGL